MTTSLAPQQQRSAETHQRLLDAFSRLLQDHSFEELTVAQIAAEADLTTGAIYRRFKDKRALLEASFENFLSQTLEFQPKRQTAVEGFSDFEKVAYMIRATLKFTTPYIPLMRAASALNDQSSFELMLTARHESADWLATKLESSALSAEELQQRTRFAMRMITAVIRDTLLAGPSKGQKTKALNAMVSELTEMTASYLQIQKG